MSQYHYDVSGKLVVTEKFWTSQWRKDTRKQLNAIEDSLEPRLWNHIQTIHTSLDEKYQLLLEQIQLNSNRIRESVGHNTTLIQTQESRYQQSTTPIINNFEAKLNQISTDIEGINRSLNTLREELETVYTNINENVNTVHKNLK